jgi:hypothetical protein
MEPSLDVENAGYGEWGRFALFTGKKKEKKRSKALYWEPYRACSSEGI